jgi:hypothetical protein
MITGTDKKYKRNRDKYYLKNEIFHSQHAEKNLD